MPSPGLALLALRRLLSRTFLLAALALAALWTLQSFEVREATQAADEALLRATRRESTWLIFALCLLPTCFWAAARVGERWFDGDRDWIGARAITHARFLFSTWCGLWLAAALVCLAIGVGSELAAGGSGASARELATLDSPTLLLLEDEARGSWVLDEREGVLREGRELRLELRATPGAGPTARVRLSGRRVSSAKRTSMEAIVSGRTRVVLELPPGAGPLELELEKLGPGCGVLVLPGALDLFEPIASERSGSVALVVRVLAWLGAWLAVALALGTWMRAATATVLTLALQLPLWSLASSPSRVREVAAHLLPGLGLPRALALVGDGLAPALPSHTILLGLALLTGGALWSAGRGLRRGGPS